jgi:hypothetical protein
MADARLRAVTAFSHFTDDETGEIRAVLLLQVDHGVGAALPHVNAARGTGAGRIGGLCG